MKQLMKKVSAFIFIFVLTVSAKAFAKNQLLIAVASNFHLPLEAMIERSEFWRTQDLRLVVASSGSLYAQAINGAPFDLFLSADEFLPDKLLEKDLATGVHQYIRGKLVIWPKQASSVCASDGTIVIAEPRLAPYGKAAMSYLSQCPNYDFLVANIVKARNVSHAFQLVDTGNAELAILAESLLIQAYTKLSDDKYLNYHQINEVEYSPIIQSAAVMQKTQNPALAKKFIEFLVSESSQTYLSDIGYRPVLGSDRDD